VLAIEISAETQVRPQPVPQESPGAFALRDCALIAIATGVRAHNLKELQDRIVNIEPGCLYYHFWGGLLRPRFDDPEYRNDFAIWVRSEVHDEALAEQLASVDPTQHETLEGLREAVLEAVETRLEVLEAAAWQRAENPFHFVRSQIAVFDTGRTLRRPQQLAESLPNMSLGSVFYHFIDARRRVPERLDDFRVWLLHWGSRYQDLCNRLAEVDYYFVSLAELRRELAQILGEYFEIPPQRTDEDAA
jgi:hypothetical protein